jgi:hypothetical protein
VAEWYSNDRSYADFCLAIACQRRKEGIIDIEQTGAIKKAERQPDTLPWKLEERMV